MTDGDPPATPIAVQKKKGVFKRIAEFFEELASEVQENLSDPIIREMVRQDMGLPPGGPADPGDFELSPEVKAKIEAANEAGFAETMAEIAAIGGYFADLANVISEDDADFGWDLIYALVKTMTSNMLRARVPWLFALARIGEFVAEDPDVYMQLEPARLVAALHGKEPVDGKERLWRDIMGLVGVTITIVEPAVKLLDARLDAFYGWDPAPESDTPIGDRVSQDALTLIIYEPDPPDTLLITIMPVPPDGGSGPGLLISLGGGVTAERAEGRAKGKLMANLFGTLEMFFPLPGSPKSFQMSADPKAYLRCDVQRSGEQGGPSVVLGKPGETRIEIGEISWGVEVTAGGAGGRAAIQDGQLILVIASDGFLAQVIGEEIRVGFDVGAAFDPIHGLRLDGGTRIGVTIPVKQSLLGLLTVQHIELAIGSGTETQDLALEVSGAFTANLGPFRATVDQIGILFGLTIGDVGKQPRPENGILDLDIDFKPPTGVGMSLDAGVVKGGGYLFFDYDKGEYAGALELKFGPVGVKAIGLLSTRMEDGGEGWSLLLLVFGQFPPIQLGFGITLTGIGGMIGLQHGMDVGALMTGMSTGVLDDVLFPKDAVADAPRIIKSLRVVFPQTRGALVVGPMLQLAWGTKALVDLRVGVLLQLDDALGSGPGTCSFSRIVVIGQLRVDKTAEGVVLLRLLADILVDFDMNAGRFTLVARLRDSQVGGMTISGMLVIAAGRATGQQPSFVLAAGGFHPAFTDLPPGLPAKIDRVSVSIKKPPLTIDLSGYFAVTTSSVQFGAEIKAYAKVGPVELKGWLGFDALFKFEPTFSFRLDLKAGVTLLFAGETLASVELTMILSGPGLWHATGTAKLTFLFWDIEAPFDVQWGVPSTIEEALTNLGVLVKAALSTITSWSAALPADGESVVTLGPFAVPENELLAHPLGMLSVVQKVAPFGLQVQRYGYTSVVGDTLFAVSKVTIGGAVVTDPGKQTEFFAPSQFLNLTEDEKLSKRSFERFPAGVALATDAYRTPAYAPGAKPVAAAMTYETGYLVPKAGGGPGLARPADDLAEALAVDADHTLTFAELAWQSGLGAAARSSLRDAARMRPPDSPRVRVHEPALKLVDTDTLAPVAGGALDDDALRTHTLASQQASALGANCQVVEQHELAVKP